MQLIRQNLRGLLATSIPFHLGYPTLLCSSQKTLFNATSNYQMRLKDYLVKLQPNGHPRLALLVRVINFQFSCPIVLMHNPCNHHLHLLDPHLQQKPKNCHKWK